MHARDNGQLETRLLKTKTQSVMVHFESLRVTEAYLVNVEGQWDGFVQPDFLKGASAFCSS